MNDEPKLRFRKIFVVEPSHDIRALSQYTDNITFVTNGKEDIKDIPRIVSNALLAFDPDLDAIVPVGRVITSMVTGIHLGMMFSIRLIHMGVYREGDYTFARIQV